MAKKTDKRQSNPKKKTKSANPRPQKIGPAPDETVYQVETVPIDSVVPDPDNCRIHDDRNLSLIETSLRRFGQQKPIIVTEEMRIVAGHGTLEAAKRIGWKSIVVSKTSLTGDAARAYAIADNRTGETSAWDFERLSGSLRAIEAEFPAEVMGWNPDEMAAIGGAEWSPPTPTSTATAERPGRHIRFSAEQWEAIKDIVKDAKGEGEDDAAAIVELLRRR